MASGDIRIGISGWTYGRWRGVFYPEKLPRKRELGFAARCFPSIEINGTFYRLLQPDSFARWRDETPPGFVFAVKGQRFITHMRRMKDIEKALANFLQSGEVGSEACRERVCQHGLILGWDDTLTNK